MLQCGCRCWSCSLCELKSTLLFHKNTQETEHLKPTFCWKQRGLASLLFGSVLCLKCQSEEVGVEPRLWFAEEHSDTGRWNSRVRSPCLSFLYHWHKHSHICQKPKVRGKERKKRWYLLRQNRFEVSGISTPQKKQKTFPSLNAWKWQLFTMGAAEHANPSLIQEAQLCWRCLKTGYQLQNWCLIFCFFCSEPLANHSAVEFIMSTVPSQLGQEEPNKP